MHLLGIQFVDEVLTLNPPLHLQISLEKGQIQPSYSLKNWADVEFILENTKFKVKVVKTGPNAYLLVMNGSTLDLEAHRYTLHTSRNTLHTTHYK